MAAKNKILLIDDNEIHLDLAEVVLRDEYEIHKAKSGEEAISKLIKDDFVPNLILLDIVMPDMDGYATYNKIRGISLLKDVPIAFLTAVGRASEAEKRHAYAIGICDYIVKSDNLEELKKRIRDIISK